MNPMVPIICNIIRILLLNFFSSNLSKMRIHLIYRNGETEVVEIEDKHVVWKRHNLVRKLQMELGLHVARFLKKPKITLLSFKKFGT
jgi:hypothetical protein